MIDVTSTKAKGKSLVCSMLRATSGRFEASTSCSFQSAQLGTNLFCISSAVSFVKRKVEAEDLSCFYGERITNLNQHLLKSEASILQFWESRLHSHLTLAKVALRIYATVPSSCSIGRDSQDHFVVSQFSFEARSVWGHSKECVPSLLHHLVHENSNIYLYIKTQAYIQVMKTLILLKTQCN